jgi:hypothetical protein
MRNAPPVVRQHQKHIQDLEADGRHAKKSTETMDFQEGPPGLECG